MQNHIPVYLEKSTYYQEISYSLRFSALISILIYLDFFVNLTKQSRGGTLIKATIPELVRFIYSVEPIKQCNFWFHWSRELTEAQRQTGRASGKLTGICISGSQKGSTQEQLVILCNSISTTSHSVQDWKNSQVSVSLLFLSIPLLLSINQKKSSIFIYCLITGQHWVS